MWVAHCRRAATCDRAKLSREGKAFVSICLRGNSAQCSVAGKTTQEGRASRSMGCVVRRAVQSCRLANAVESLRRGDSDDAAELRQPAHASKQAGSQKRGRERFFAEFPCCGRTGV